MAVMPLHSLPLGFRFHPTDEELINHYLKSKIQGRAHSVEVIPEIDVCKCEPWDLPEKSLIRTEDPEWFFFAPRDRKYPNGNRSNRATEAGYWKATGKDRTIRARAATIGMKKTLVFYMGRAPKGERTSWIMHEYRVVTSFADGDLDGANGEQDSYVLCRLFKKPEERISSPNCVEVEDSAFSLTSARSTPCVQLIEENTIQLGTPSSQEIPESTQEDFQLSPTGFQGQPNGLERSFIDEVDSGTRYSEKLANFDCKSNMGSNLQHYVSGKPEIDPLMAALDRICGPQSETTEIDDYPQNNSPTDLDNIFFDFPKEYCLELQGSDTAKQDSISECLDTILNSDEFSSGWSYDHRDPVFGPMSGSLDASMLKGKHHFGTEWHNDSGLTTVPNTDIVYKAHLDTDSSGLMYTESNLPPTPVPAYPVGDIYGSRPASDTSGLFTPGSRELTDQENLASNRNSGLEGTGIMIRSRQSSHPAPLPTMSQGTAYRRIRLQRDPQMESVCSSGSVTSSSLESAEVCSSSNDGTLNVHEHTEQHVAKEVEPSHLLAPAKNAEIQCPDHPPQLKATSHLPGLGLRKSDDDNGDAAGGDTCSSSIKPSRKLKTSLRGLTFLALSSMLLVALAGVALTFLLE